MGFSSSHAGQSLAGCSICSFAPEEMPFAISLEIEGLPVVMKLPYIPFQLLASAPLMNDFGMMYF